MKMNSVLTAVCNGGQTADFARHGVEMMGELGLAVGQAQRAVQFAGQQVVGQVLISGRYGVVRRGIVVDHAGGIRVAYLVVTQHQLTRPVIGPFGPEQTPGTGGRAVGAGQSEGQQAGKGNDRPDLQKVTGGHIDRVTAPRGFFRVIALFVAGRIFGLLRGVVFRFVRRSGFFRSAADLNTIASLF